MHRSRRRLARLLTVVATAAALVLGSNALGLAAPPDDGSQPLPGWTVTQPTLTPIQGAGGTTTVHQGIYEHAGYYVEIPANWNGELVMYAHGYRGTGSTLYTDAPPFGLRQLLVAQGYAWAASSYYANGYDVRAGVESTHDLALMAGKDLLPKKPKRTYIVGVSMGGHVVGRSLEEYPKMYDGALPMCGVMGDHVLFDYFLDFNLVAQALAGVDAYPPPADYQTAVVPKIQQTLGLTGLTFLGDPTTAEGQQLRAITVDLTGGVRPGANAAFAYWKDFLFTNYQPDGTGDLSMNPGRLSQNIDTVYSPNAPVDVNAAVERVSPIDQASRDSRKLTQIPAIQGKPKVPVLSLHNIGDLFVPFSMEQEYALDVAANGQSSLLVQRVIRSTGHCEFGASEAAAAWNDLTTWVEANGVPARDAARPAGDDVLDPAVVADPAYGCRFTDPALYGTGTRGLYQPCPAG